MIRIKQKGDFSKTTNFFKRISDAILKMNFSRYGRRGVDALRSATPVDTGRTAESWSYTVVKTKDSVRIQFFNSNIQNDVPIAIILQYGHATRNGGWVAGRDYINPAIRPVFDELAKEAWWEVTK